MLTGEFSLIFDDGEIQTNYKECIYSSYVWDLLREFPIDKMSVNYHLSACLSKGEYRSDTHLKLLGNVMWDIYHEYVKKAKTEEDEWQLRKYLRRRVAEIFNLIYNDLSYRCEEYVTSLDILDLIEVHEHPKVKRANDTVVPNQKSIDNTYKIIQQVLNDRNEIPHNAVSKIVRSGNANAGQINQCLGPRGFLTDIDSNIFKEPILVSYLRGIHSLHDSMIESRLASKSLIFSKKPLQQAEFFSRRLQLMNQVVRNLHMRDCGSRHYLAWHVRGPHRDNHGNKIEGDLKNLRGIFYKKEDGSEDWIRGHEEHLIGQHIELRNPIYCQDPDPVGVCAHCFGKLAFSTFKDCNIGQYCWTFVAEKSTQSVLSVKHYDGSSVVDSIYIAEDLTQFLKVGAGGSSYLFSEKLKGKKFRLILHPSNAEGINDLKKVDDVRKLNLSRVTEIDEIGFEIFDEVDSTIYSVEVGMKGRRASFTYDFLRLIKENGYQVNHKHSYVFELDGWDWSLPFMVLPLKHYSMSQHSQQMAALIESRIDQMKTRDTEVSPDAFLVEFFDLVNSKLSVNLAVLSIVIYGIMVTSAIDENYSLPKPYTDSGLGVMRLIMNRRSMSALLAYQGQRDAIKDPINYIGKNRISHPFDDIVMPELIPLK